MCVNEAESRWDVRQTLRPSLGSPKSYEKHRYAEFRQMSRHSSAELISWCTESTVFSTLPLIGLKSQRSFGSVSGKFVKEKNEEGIQFSAKKAWSQWKRLNVNNKRNGKAFRVVMTLRALFHWQRTRTLDDLVVVFTLVKCDTFTSGLHPVTLFSTLDLLSFRRLCSAIWIRSFLSVSSSSSTLVHLSSCLPASNVVYIVSFSGSPWTLRI